jgi:hypothetical protein
MSDDGPVIEVFRKLIIVQIHVYDPTVLENWWSQKYLCACVRVRVRVHAHLCVIHSTRSKWMGFVAWFSGNGTEFKLCVDTCVCVHSHMCFCILCVCDSFYRSVVIRKYSTYSRLQKTNNLICRGVTEFRIPKTFKLIMTEIKPVHEETYFTYFKFKFPIAF